MLGDDVVVLSLIVLPLDEKTLKLIVRGSNPMRLWSFGVQSELQTKAYKGILL